jgi:hypothetical protein
MKVWDIFFKIFPFSLLIVWKKAGASGIRWEGVTCEAVMKENIYHFKKVVESQEISVLNAAMCDICLVIIYFYSYVKSIQTNLTW